MWLFSELAGSAALPVIIWLELVFACSELSSFQFRILAAALME
jgi:hypothetical protein